MSQSILVVDDDPVTRETLRAYLEAEGYGVQTARNGDEMTELLRRHPVDLVLLDIRLPGKDGLTLTRELRSQSEIGIILITSRADTLDRIIGLEMGADDHIAKPFDQRETLARIRNLLRRLRAATPQQPDRVRRFAGWSLYLDRRRLLDVQGQDVHLTSAEFELLASFVCNPGRILSRDYLLTVTARRKSSAQDRTIDTLVRRLRRLLGDDAREASLIVTVHGSGYVFAGDIDP